MLVAHTPHSRQGEVLLAVVDRESWRGQAEGHDAAAFATGKVPGCRLNVALRGDVGERQLEGQREREAAAFAEATASH